jgi:predicted TIM-barrel fold metal-dependent hydrolase
LTHCTSHGFEAKRGNGQLYADPRLWRRVLEERGFDRLRLCFGHAGGEQGWFPRALDLSSVVGKSSFSSEVLALCREFPHVYCETAYLSPILKQNGRDRFQRALRKALTAPAQFPLAKKVMYGSDWHMIHTLQDHRLYLPSFVSALGSSEWDGLRDDFFFRNAVRWLDLPAYLDRTAKTDAPWFGTTARCYLENLCALAGTPVPDSVCTIRTGDSRST